jgi:Flp pilus assembly protein CpaB
MVRVSLSSPPRTAPPSSPAATRAHRPSWRDPRLAVGIVLVCASVLLGARVLAGADDTVPVLAARAPLAAGERVDADDLQVVRLRFATEADADRYLPDDAGAVAGAVLLRPVGAGELVPRASLATGGDQGLVELPLPVDPHRVPASVRAGAVVDVWALPLEAGPRQRARVLLEAVPVLSATRPTALGPSGVRQVVVGVGPADQERLEDVVAGLGAEGALLLTRRPG